METSKNIEILAESIREQYDPAWAKGVLWTNIPEERREEWRKQARDLIETFKIAGFAVIHIESVQKEIRDGWLKEIYAGEILGTRED